MIVKSYILNSDHDEHLKGTRVYDCVKCDYGLASDDTRMTDVEHISVTLNEFGDYPSFTIPQYYLDEFKVH